MAGESPATYPSGTTRRARGRGAAGAAVVAGGTLAAGQLQHEEGDPQHPIGLRLGPHVSGQAQAERAVACARERTTQRGIAPPGHHLRHLRALLERRLLPKQRQAREVGDDPARGQRHDLSALSREQAAPLGAGLAEEEVERARQVASGAGEQMTEQAFHGVQAGSLQLVRRRRRGVVGGEAGGAHRAVSEGYGQGRIVGFHRLDAQGHRTHPQLVARAQARALDAHTVRQGAVLAAHVLEHQAVLVQRDEGMAPRDAAHREHDGVPAHAADPVFTRGQGVGAQDAPHFAAKPVVRSRGQGTPPLEGCGHSTPGLPGNRSLHPSRSRSRAGEEQGSEGPPAAPPAGFRGGGARARRPPSGRAAQ